jgi:N-acetylmuramoyl-L-alanine amidase
MEEQMIHISGGHNPEKRGATNGEISEFPETLRWAEQIVEELKKMNVQACVVPTGTLGHKVRSINSKPATMAIEIHFNADPSSRGKGCETLYHPGSTKGADLANAIQQHMASFFPPNRGVKEGWYKMDRPGAVDYRGDVDGDEMVDYFLRKTKCPAVIIEPEFIHNQQVIEANMDVGCQVIAEAIAEVYDEWRV